MKLLSKKQTPMQAFLQRYTLPLVVFLTGACVLVIELAAIRVLSPYFGNTLYTTSSVLGVILAALSIGYYVGGRQADKQPSEQLFFTIILLGGLATLLLQVLALFFLPMLGVSLSILNGPLITSVLLFFLPAFLLGTLSPFVIKLQTLRLPKLGTGTVAGEVFFWSTLGSIAGSLATGFVLVPFFGIDNTIIGTGILLTLLGGLPLLRYATGKKLLLFIMPTAAGFFLLSTAVLIWRHTETVYADDGVYERLTIYDGEYRGEPTRFFQQDRSSSSAMYLNSEELIYDYSKYYELYKGVVPDARQSLVIGGAAYSIPKVLLAQSPYMKVDVAEIEPSLYELSKKYFKVKDDPRLKNYVMDGRRLLTTSKKQYNLIFSDVYYSLYSIPSHFTTKEFFQTAKAKLSKNGLFMANLIGDLSPRQPSFIFSEINTFKQVFDTYDVFAVRSPSSTTAQNIIIVGYNGKRPDLSSPVFTKSNNEVLRSLSSQRVNIEKIDLSGYHTLTDNHAPVEYLMSRVLRETIR